MDDRFCAPHRADLQQTTGSCLTLAELRVVADAWNASNPGNRIPHASFAKKPDLWSQINDRLKESCGKAVGSSGEHCWVQKVDQSPGVRAIRNESLRPVKPSAWYMNKNEWLNTYDILLVMKQYEKLHRDFKFVGVFPRDFAYKHDGLTCVAKEMCDPSLFDHQKSGKKRFGFVFNHDAHNQPGSHWVALFMSFDQDSKLFGSHYFDSTGREPKAEVLKFMTKTFIQKSLPITSVKSPVRKQFKNTECGMFALNFLINCVESPTDKSYSDIVKSMGTDSEIEKLRDVFFTPNYSVDRNVQSGGRKKTFKNTTPKSTTNKKILK